MTAELPLQILSMTSKLVLDSHPKWVFFFFFLVASILTHCISAKADGEHIAKVQVLHYKQLFKSKYTVKTCIFITLTDK